jgi:Amt family ammonium transporter
MAVASMASAETSDPVAPTASIGLTASNIWMMIATFLVFIMHLGFASLEAGLTRSKNTVNILFKNTLIPAIGLLTYAWFGFNLMYPGTFNGVLGFAGFGLPFPTVAGGFLDLSYNEGYTYWTDFLFQGMFAATAATIVSGAVAERIKLHSFLVFSTVFVGLVYPVVGSWKWGGGWLDSMGF